MPTLDELRRWARGEKVTGAGLPEEKKSPKAVDVEDETLIVPSGRTSSLDDFALKPLPPSKGSGKYKMSADGNNAFLKFGMHTGKTLSDIVNEPRGRSYLRWLIENVEEDDLKAAAKYQLEAYRERKRKE